MQILLNPQSVASIQGLSGEKGEEVYLRAVSLLKNIINTSWSMSSQPGGEANKENVCTVNQAQNGQWMQREISEEEKKMVKTNIFRALDIASVQSKRIS